jgi:hypothetical protein
MIIIPKKPKANNPSIRLRNKKMDIKNIPLRILKKVTCPNDSNVKGLKIFSRKLKNLIGIPSNSKLNLNLKLLSGFNLITSKFTKILSMKKSAEKVLNEIDLVLVR